MTPLEQYFTKAASTAIDLLTAGDIEVLSEAVNLLWNLVEASATAFRSVPRSYPAFAISLSLSLVCVSVRLFFSFFFYVCLFLSLIVCT